MFWRRRGARDESDDGCNDDADEDSSWKLSYGESCKQHESEHGDQCRMRGQMTGLHRRTGYAESNQSSLIESDERKKQPDSDPEAVTQTRGNAFYDPLAQAQDGKENKQCSGDEDSGKSRLPG